MLSTLEKLRLALQLRSVGQALSYSDPPAARRVSLTRKAAGMRATLLNRRQASITDLDLFNSSEAVPMLRAHFDSLKDADEVTRTQAAGYLDIIVSRVNALEKQAGGTVGWDDPAAVLHSDVNSAYQPWKLTYKAAQFGKFAAAGADVLGLPETMKESAEEIHAINAESSALMAGQQARLEAVYAEMAKDKERAFDTFDKVRDGLMTRDEADAIRMEYSKKLNDLTDAIRADVNVKINANRARLEAAKLRGSATAADLKRGILAGSPVSQEEADAWAASQSIETSARTALKKKGYDPVQVRADMAEFYRLTGGRLAKVTIRTSRGRASAEGIHGHSSSIINMGANFDKRVLFHELAHHLERDPVAVAAAKGFLEKRRESEKVYTLRSLTGWKSYGAKEVAHKDAWFNHYVGKVYNYDVTEVMSMGVESFCDDFTLASRIQQDPEHFALIAGFMRTPPDPLFKAVKQVFAQQADAETEVAEVQADERESSLAVLAGGVTLTKLDPPPLDPPFMGLYRGTYIGSYSGIHVYLCKALRKYATKRKCTGYLLSHVRQREERNWSTNLMEMRPAWSTTNVFGPEIEVKAAARLWAADPSAYPPSLADTEKLKQYAKAYAA